MLEAADEAVGFTGGRTRHALEHDRALALVLVKLIEIVGEAASRVSEQGRSAASHLPWPLMTGIRNRLVHAYYDIDLDIVWTTVTVEFPQLCTQLEAILDAPAGGAHTEAD